MLHPVICVAPAASTTATSTARRAELRSYLQFNTTYAQFINSITQTRPRLWQNAIVYFCSALADYNLDFDLNLACAGLRQCTLAKQQSETHESA
jgi:hypothetical protein